VFGEAAARPERRANELKQSDNFIGKGLEDLFEVGGASWLGRPRDPKTSLRKGVWAKKERESAQRIQVGSGIWI
jgi:hypothetical protein